MTEKGTLQIIHVNGSDHCRMVDRLIERALPGFEIVRHLHRNSGSHVVDIKWKEPQRV